MNITNVHVCIGRSDIDRVLVDVVLGVVALYHANIAHRTVRR